MRKTALELAIEECSKLKDNFNSPTNEKIDDIIIQLTNLIPTDKDNLRHAYNHSCTDKSFEYYYKENYG